jgi:putative DNA primase/helicase
MSAADFINDLSSNRFSYSEQSHIWRVWDGTIHASADSGEVPYLIRQFARAYKQAMRLIRDSVIAQRMREEGETPQEAEDHYERVWKKHRKFRDDIWFNTAQERILRQLSRQLTVSEARFDALDGYVVASNGVIGITSAGAVLMDHDQGKLVTLRLGDVSYRPDAEAPAFRHFLETSITDEPMRTWLQQSLGLALIGKPRKGFVNLIGKTNSGKSTLVRALQNVLGTYASPVSVETFLEGPGNNDFRLHSLKGVRFAFASEPAAGRKLDTESVKSITGGDMQETRRIYGDFVKWKPQCLIIITSNQPQRFETSDTAMLSRIEAIAFTNRHAMDRQLDEKLKAEADGILRWLVEGAVEALRADERGGRELPQSMLSLREVMAETVDDCLRFLTEAVENGWLRADQSAELKHCVSVGEAYQQYVAWCSGEGIQQRFIAGRKQFSQRVGRRYPTAKHGTMRFSGLLPRES